MKTRILPSLMAKSQQELDADLKKLKGIVKELHIDVVDGKFAPNKTFQFEFKLTNNFSYNAHLMVNEPQKWIKKHADKVQTIIFHPEVVDNPELIIKIIKTKHKKVGLALKPETRVKLVEKYLKQIDYLLILTVHPGFYGAKFLSAPLQKISKAKQINPKLKVIVDGGMNPKIIGKVVRAGADLFVSGSYTTKAEHPLERIKTLEKEIKRIKK